MKRNYSNTRKLLSCQYSSRIALHWFYYLSEIFFRPSLVKPLTLVLSFSIFSSILSFFFCSSCASNDSNPSSSAFCTLLFNIASFVFSAILSLVSSECFFPTFHGTFPLFAADIFALLESEWGWPAGLLSPLLFSSFAFFSFLSVSISKSTSDSTVLSNSVSESTSAVVCYIEMFLNQLLLYWRISQCMVMHSVRFCKSSSCWDWSTSEEQLNENKKQIQIDHSHRLETIDIIHYWAWSLTVQYSLWFLLNFLFKAEYDRVDVPSDGLTCVHGCCCWTIPRNKTELDRNPKHSIFKRATDATNKKMFEIPLGLVIKKTTIVSSPSYICITAILDKLESHYPCDCKFLSGTLNIL